MHKLEWRILNEIPAIGRRISHVDLVKILSAEFKGQVKEKSFSKKVIYHMKKLREAAPETIAITELGKLHRIEWMNDIETAEFLEKLAIKVSKMRMPEILGFGVLQEIGTDLLPKFTQSALKPYFAAAKERAAQEIEERESKDSQVDPDARAVDLAKVKIWLKKIRRMPETLTFLKAPILPRVELAIHKALLFDQLIEIHPERELKPIVVYPRALVQRGARTYLFAQKRGGDVCEAFGLHKIRSAQLTTGNFVPADPEFDIDDVLKRGISDPFFPEEDLGKMIDLVMWIDDGTKRWISATPLEKDQRTTKCDSGYILTAKVPLSEELVWWILSMSYHVKVIEPPILLVRVREDARKMANLYK